MEQDIIDEIDTAIAAGWGGTAWPGPYTLSLPPVRVITEGSTIVTPDFPFPGNTITDHSWWDDWEWWPSPAPTVGPAGITGRTCLLTVVATRTPISGGPTTDASFTKAGLVDINGYASDLAGGMLGDLGGGCQTETWTYQGTTWTTYSSGYSYTVISSQIYIDRP